MVVVIALMSPLPSSVGDLSFIFTVILASPCSWFVFGLLFYLSHVGFLIVVAWLVFSIIEVILPKKTTMKTSNNKGDSTKKAKKRNFSSVEDELLCRAFFNTSENPLTGTGQKTSRFWGSIKEDFHLLYVRMVVLDEFGQEERDQEWGPIP
jgi:hypothetical protein